MNDRLPAEDGPIQLQGDVTVETADALWQPSLARLRAQSREAIVDMEQVTALDTAGLQILLMLRRLAVASGIDFGISRPSQAVRDVLEFAGLGEMILKDNAAAEAVG